MQNRRWKLLSLAAKAPATSTHTYLRGGQRCRGQWTAGAGNTLDISSQYIRNGRPQSSATPQLHGCTRFACPLWLAGPAGGRQNGIYIYM